MLIRRTTTFSQPPARRFGRLMLALLVAAAGIFAAAAPVRGAELTLAAEAMLDGHVRPGAWAAVKVAVQNDGPPLAAELRVHSTQQGVSRFGVAVELPSGAQQEHVLYVQPPLFGSRLIVELVAGDTQLATTEVPIKSHDSYTPMVAVIAERPEGFTRDVADAVRNPNFGNTPTVITIQPADLPPRVEAWSALDRLVWQDVDFGALSDRQLDALRLWVGAGGRLVVVGGSTGVAPLAALPADMVPFLPERTVDIATDDLETLLGRLPAGAGSVPAIAGTLQRGSVMGRSGDDVYAAHSSYGQGAVTIIGVDPATSWLAGTDSAEAFWRRAIPVAAGPFLNPFVIADDYVFQSALYNLPSVALPPIEQLFVLLLAYIALIGPINYLVLRRLDRREWAWLTMPALVIVFAVGSYALGAALKGSDVIVNQVAIVRAGEATGSGIGQIYVGVFSPSRRTFDVRIPVGALLSTPVSQTGSGTTEQAIDALIGENASRLRNFEVGFGVVRGFRADTTTAAPRISADLHLVDGRVLGSVTNESEAALENVAIAFGGGVTVIDRLDAGATAEVEISQQSSAFGFSIADRVFGSAFPSDPEAQRRIFTRRTLIEQVTGYGSRVQGAAPEVPVLLGWQPGPALEVQLAGERPNRVGDSLFVVPLGLTYDASAVFDDPLVVKTIVHSDSNEGWSEGDGFYMGRGTMTIEARPAGMSGTFHPTSLELALTQGSVIALRGKGQSLSPLPDAEQPDQDDPVGAAAGNLPAGGQGDEPGKPMPPPEFGGQALPALQLYDHAAGRWYEFEQLQDARSYLLEDPARWIDSTGRLLARLVNRNNVGEQAWFQLLVRMEGTIE